LRSGVTVHTVEPGGYKTDITGYNKLNQFMISAYPNISVELQDFYGGNISTFCE